MSEFNKDILTNNIAYLLKEKNKKIGELEAVAGVSSGYFSRLKDANSKPSIELVYNTANFLNISIDNLINVKLYELSNTDKYILSFIDKLLSDTSNEKLCWQLQSKDFFDKEFEGSIDDYHELLEERNYYTHYDSDIFPACNTRYVMISDAFGDKTIVNGDCYKLSMKNDTSLFLMNVASSDPYNKPTFAIEMWIYNDEDEKSMLTSTLKNETMNRKLNNLYSEVKEYLKHPRLENSFIKAIDSFMSDI